MQDPSKRKAQHLLAYEVLAMVHGEEDAINTAQQHKAMRRPLLDSLTSVSPPPSTEEVPAGSAPNTSAKNVSTDASTDRVILPRKLVLGLPIEHVLYHAGLVNSKGEGKRAVNSRGVYAGVSPNTNRQDAHPSGGLTFRQVEQETAAEDLLLKGDLLVLRMGKWKVTVIEVLEDAASEGQGRSTSGAGGNLESPKG